MKYVFIAMILAAITMASGCALLETDRVTTEKRYETMTTVVPSGVEGQYTVEFMITEYAADGTDVHKGPKLTVSAGAEGKAQSTDKEGQNGVFFTARVDETKDGVEALTTIAVKYEGRITFSSSQKTMLEK